jgi:hypothetical protein
VLTIEEEAIVIAFRRHTLLPLDDCLYALQPTIPHLSRSSLHRCLQRHGISRLPDAAAIKRGRTHDRIRTHTKFRFNYLNPAGRPHMSRGVATSKPQINKFFCFFCSQK